MSTLRALEIRDRVTDKPVCFYRARLTLDGRGNTATIRDSVGISSVSYISEGSYIVNFVSGTFQDENYAVAGEALLQNGAAGAALFRGYFMAAYDNAGAYARSSSGSFQFLTYDSAGADNDPPLWVYLVFYV